MGLFIKKKTKAALDRKKVVVSHVVLAVCILLMAINVGGFIFFPRLMAPMSILLSNAITLILAIIAFRPINALIENLLEKRQQELLEQQQIEHELEQKVDLLESRNRELENKLDTRAQTEGSPFQGHDSRRGPVQQDARRPDDEGPGSPQGLVYQEILL